MVVIQRLIDKIIGPIIINTFSIFKRKRKISKSPKNAVFIKLWAIGESIWTLNLIKDFKEKNPNTKISILLRNRNRYVYENQDFIDELIYLEPNNLIKVLSKFNKFDIAFDLEPYLKISAILGFWIAKYQIGFSHGIRRKLYDSKIKYHEDKHATISYYDMLKPFKYKINYPKESVMLKYNSNDKEIVDTLLKKINPQNNMLIGFGTTSAETSTYRRWSQNKFAKLFEKLIDQYNATIIIPDAPIHKSYINEIIKLTNKKYHNKIFNIAGETNFTQTFYLAKKCDLYISNDTGPVHVSAAMGTKTIGLYGPNTPVKYGAYGKNCINIRKCTHKPFIMPNLGTFQKPDHDCLDKISVKDVINAVEALINNK